MPKSEIRLAAQRCCDPTFDVFERAKAGNKVALAWLKEHKPLPLEAYLEFANVLIIKDCGLGYDAAIAVAKEMHRRKMVLPK